jgi:hypothetical protein
LFFLSSFFLSSSRILKYGGIACSVFFFVVILLYFFVYGQLTSGGNVANPNPSLNGKTVLPPSATSASIEDAEFENEILTVFPNSYRVLFRLKTSSSSRKQLSHVTLHSRIDSQQETQEPLAITNAARGELSSATFSLLPGSRINYFFTYELDGKRKQTRSFLFYRNLQGLLLLVLFCLRFHSLLSSSPAHLFFAPFFALLLVDPSGSIGSQTPSAVTGPAPPAVAPSPSSVGSSGLPVPPPSPSPPSDDLLAVLTAGTALPSASSTSGSPSSSVRMETLKEQLTQKIIRHQQQDQQQDQQKQQQPTTKEEILSSSSPVPSSSSSSSSSQTETSADWNSNANKNCVTRNELQVMGDDFSFDPERKRFSFAPAADESAIFEWVCLSLFLSLLLYFPLCASSCAHFLSCCVPFFSLPPLCQVDLHYMLNDGLLHSFRLPRRSDAERGRTAIVFEHFDSGIVDGTKLKFFFSIKVCGFLLLSAFAWFSFLPFLFLASVSLSLSFRFQRWKTRLPKILVPSKKLSIRIPN